MREIRGWDVVQHPTDVTSPATTVVGPGDVRVDVGATPFAADNAGLLGRKGVGR